MARLIKSITGLSLALSTHASHPSSFQELQYNGTSPCAQVASSIATQTAATPTVSAQMAYACLNSVPFNQSAALALVDSFVPYFRWQSTTLWLKNPPKEYSEKLQPGVDIWGELEEIRNKVVANKYNNEYEFGWALYRLSQTTHDGHFFFVPDIIGTVFNFARPIPLVSVSSDGKELPKSYVYSDILAESFSNATFKASPIIKIDGQDAEKFLENWAQYGILQDRDALYNNIFYDLATVSLGPVGSGIGTFAGSGRGRWIYPGATTTIDFANGTSNTYNNLANVLIPFHGITDGDSLYKIWFTGNPPAPTENPAPSNSTISAPGYPPPVVRESHNLIGGYFLEDEYSDVAVLSVPSFVSTDGLQKIFQNTAVQFLAAAKAAGKKKLVIDLSANAGGTVLLGYDLYAILFPKNIDHASADQFRAFESTDIIGQQFSKAAEGVTREPVTKEQNETVYELQDNVLPSSFVYSTDLKLDGKHFSSWKEKFGPRHSKGGNVTSLFHWNLDDLLIFENSGGIYIHGHGPLANYTQQPFAAENVVVITNGYCASTCHIFSDLMRQRAGVKHIALGGRPREGITQAVGGVKGAQNFSWSRLQQLAQYAVLNLTSSAKEAAQLNTTELNQYWSSVPFDRAAIGLPSQINFRDGIRDGDETNTPLQFVYEPADCRILYTKQMTVDVTAIWKAAADSTWGGKSHCIAGKLDGHRTNNLVKRKLSAREETLSKRMKHWRRELRSQDYPLDVRTDTRKAKIIGNGFMWP